MYCGSWGVPHCCFLKRSRFALPPSPHLPQTSSITSVCFTWWSAIYFRYAHVVSDSATWKCLHLMRRSNQTRRCVAIQLQLNRAEAAPGVFKIHTVLESRKVMWDESLLICHHVHRDLRVAHTMGRRSNWCLFMGGNDSLGRYIEDFQSSFGLDFLALSPINSHLTEHSRTWWLKCSASLRLSDVR